MHVFLVVRRLVRPPIPLRPKSKYKELYESILPDQFQPKLLVLGYEPTIDMPGYKTQLRFIAMMVCSLSA